MNLKELKTQLNRQYAYRIELHAHSKPASGCSEVTPKELIDTYRAIGYDAVTLTNHFLFSESLSKKEYVARYLNDFFEAKAYGEERGIAVYLGAEIRFTENNNDYLLYGVDAAMLEDIYELLPHGLEHFRTTYPMPDSVFVQAHPLRDGIQRIDPVWLDGTEAFNMHPHHNGRVGLAALYAQEEQHAVVIAGSDFHHPHRRHEGVAAIRTAVLPEDTFALAKLLKSGDYLLEIGRGYLVL